MDKEIFETIEDTYEDVMSHLESVTEVATAAALFDNLENYNPLAHFDILLQYSLLEVAFADKEFNPSEIAMIESLTKYGDIFDYLRNRNLDSGYYWDNIVIAKPLDFYGFLFSIKEDIRNLAIDFVLLFATVDVSNEDVDLVSDLRSKVKNIIFNFAAVDNKIDMEELKTHCLVLELLDSTDTLKVELNKVMKELEDKIGNLDSLNLEDLNNDSNDDDENKEPTILN